MLFCMRTTLRLDDGLMRQAKAHAALTGRTLTAFIEDAVRQALAAGDPSTKPPRYRVRTFRSGLRPGVDLDSNAALLDLMGEGE